MFNNLVNLSTFCIDVTGYNKTGYLTKLQFIDLKTKSSRLIDHYIKIFNKDYKL